MGPLASLIIMTYNQSNFIEDAIKGAFAQTYSNLEIIISDDASTDGTYEKAVKLVNQYNGSHKVRILRNSTNLGLARHLNKLWFTEAKGSWLIPSAGDDVSVKTRVEDLMNFVGDSSILIHTDHECIDEKGCYVNCGTYERNTERYDKLKNCTPEEIFMEEVFVNGCSMAINKRFIQYWGPFNVDVINEDKILAYRAKFCGEVEYLNRKLVAYRRHSKSVSFHEQNKKQINSWESYKYVRSLNLTRKLEVANQFLSDRQKVTQEKLSNPRVIKYIRALQIQNSFIHKRGFQLSYLRYGVFYKEMARIVIGRVVFQVKNYLLNKNNL